MMKHIRAFFGALEEWLNRHHISLSSPSGLTKTCILLQVASLLFETGSQIVVPIPGEHNAFTITRLNNVKNFDDLVEKAKGEGISKLGERDIEKAFANLVKKKNFPFFSSDGQHGPTDNSLQNLKNFFSEKGNEVSVIRLTKIRDNSSNYIKIPNSKNTGDKKMFVPTDGSHATSLILFVHSERPQTNPATDNGDKSETQIRTTSSSECSSARAHVSEGSFQPAGEQFLLFRNKFKKWEISNKNEIDQYCLHFGKKILTDYFESDISNKDMSVWQRVLALLLIKMDELIKEDRPCGLESFFSALTQFSKTDSWTDLQIFAKNVLKEETKVEGLKPVVMSLYDNAIVRDTDSAALWKMLSESTDSLRDMFGTKTADGNGSSTVERCPICAVGFFTTGLLKEHLAEHQEAISGQPVVLELRDCPICPKGGKLEAKGNLLPHFTRFHADPSFTKFLSVPGIGLFKCSHCQFPEGEIRLFKTASDLAAHMMTVHADLAGTGALYRCPDCPGDMTFSTLGSLRRHASTAHRFESERTGVKRKPEESASPEAKRTPQVKSSSSRQPSAPSVSYPEVQLFDNFKNTDNETASTSYGSSMSYSDHLNSVQGSQETSTTVPLTDFLNLSVLFSEDEINQLLYEDHSAAF